MKKRTIYIAALLFSVTAFLFTSCDNVKNDEGTNLTSLDVEMGEDDAVAEDAFNTVESTVDNELTNLELTNFQASSLKSTTDDPYECKTVTVDKPDTSNFPKTITIDYGEGCTAIFNGDTITRKGAIQIVITDHWFVDGATRTITFIDFSINDIQIEGTITVANLGPNEKGNMVFEINVDGGSLTYNDTIQYTRNSHRYREWVRTNNPLNDTILVIGESEGVNGDGYQYKHQILNPLVLIRCYTYKYMWTIVSGTMEMDRNGHQAQLDYGNGACDDEAYLTVDGQQREIKIHNRYHNRRKFFTRKGNM